MGSLCLIFRTRNNSPELDHNHDRPSAAYIMYTGINSVRQCANLLPHNYI